MYFDSLTVSGLAIIALYALLPLVFGKEFLWVKEDQGQIANAANKPDKRADARRTPDPCPEPCEDAA
jgi:hypothetical protein